MFKYVAIAALLSGCQEYIYRPAEHATAQIYGRVAAQYQIPEKAPEGDLRIASFGLSKVSPPNAPDQKQRMVHLRMVIANNSHDNWNLDAREVRVDFPLTGQVAPAYVRSREGQLGLPLVTIPPGGERSIDLFYPMPLGQDKASRLPAFSAVWQVHTPAQVVAQRTPFDRLAIEPVYAYGYGPGWGWYGGWGGPYWYDPLYAGLPAPYLSGSVVVGAPSW